MLIAWAVLDVSGCVSDRHERTTYAGMIVLSEWSFKGTGLNQSMYVVRTLNHPGISEWSNGYALCPRTSMLD